MLIGCIYTLLPTFKIMGLIKASKKHKLGNAITGICSVLDGLVLLITIGNYTPNFVLSWNMHRRETGMLYDNKR